MMLRITRKFNRETRETHEKISREEHKEHNANNSLCSLCSFAAKICGVLIAFHKPFGVLSQFTATARPTNALAEFGFPKNVWPIGRLDADSEGLLLLSDEPEWNEKLLHPRHAHEREYWAQVEKIPARESLNKLATGMVIQGRKTLPARAWLLEPQPKVAASSLRLPKKRDAHSAKTTPFRRATRPSASAKAFLIAGLAWNWSRARTGRCGA
jgi:pseudouridine synthase